MGSICFKCDQLCCKYITVNIKTPKTILDFDNILWYMVHENVHVFKDSDGWYLIVFNKCANMKGGKCGIYEKRPFTCREHSEKDCEKSRGLNAGTERYFNNTSQFEDYCRQKFKSWDKRFD